MISAENVASYFISKDKSKKMFNYKLLNNNDRIFYEGNARLNKYLFLTQVVYLAKYGKKLINDDFIAYDNGPIVREVVSKYSIIKLKNKDANISSNIKIFLDKIYDALKNATCEELIEISHEDPEWIRLSDKTHNAPIMQLEKHIDEYKERYKGLIQALNL